MSEWGELYGTPEPIVFEFFLHSLRETLGKARLDEAELHYNASILATSALLPTTRDIADVLDQFVLQEGLSRNPFLLEAAGAQCLLMTGFLAPQMNGRHRGWPTKRDLVGWSRDGTDFFLQASEIQPSRYRGQLLEQMAKNFELWRRINACLARYFVRNQIPLFKPS